MVRLRCLGMGMVPVAGDGVIVLEDEGKGTVLLPGQQRDDYSQQEM